MIRRVNSIAWITLLAALGFTTAAQTYSIRVEFNTNIRAEPSQDAPRSETVAAGTVLEVISEFNGWLRVNRGAEAWMAGWVRHERVETPAGTAKLIDNCCGIDRQCHNDQDWEAGYWAFQDGQCPARAVHTQTETPMSTQPDANVDNCCFIGWQCHSQQDWIYGYRAYQQGQCEAGTNPPGQSQPAPSSHGRVRISQLSDGFAKMVNRAFELLRTRAPQWYAYAVNGLNEVREAHNIESSHVFASTAVAVYHHAPHSIRPYIPQDDITMAEFLVHEACHVYQHREGRLNHSCPMVYDEYECEAIRMRGKIARSVLAY